MATKNIGLWTPGATGVIQGPAGPAGPQGQPAPGDSAWAWINYPVAGCGAYVRTISGGNVLHISGRYWPPVAIPAGQVNPLGWLPYTPQGVRQFAACICQDPNGIDWRPAMLCVNWSAAGGYLEILTLQSAAIYFDFRSCVFSMYPVA